MLVEVKGGVSSKSAVALVPDQAPEAAHVVAFCDDQLSVAVSPAVTEVGLALKNVMVGGGGATATVTDCPALPPAPLHVRINVRVCVKALRVSLPAVALVPDQSPEAVQEVVSVDDHVNVVASL